MKRFVSIVLIIAVLIAGFALPAFAASQVPEITAEAALVMDLTTGEFLYEKNADQRMYPASITKIVTAILAIENVSMDDTLTADEEVASTMGSRLGMKVGEQISGKDALYAMLVGSCNDIAVLFAKKMSGSTEEFAKLMNQKAAELGCINTNFVTANGLHDDNHYTTAHDIAKIAYYCMQNPTFKEVVALPEYTFTRGSGAAEAGTEKTVSSTNWLLGNDSTAIYAGSERRTPKYSMEKGDPATCIGIKTGMTPESGGCLVTAASDGTTTIMTIVLKSGGDSGGSYERVADSILLLNWAYANYKTQTVAQMGQPAGTIKVKKGEVNKVDVVVARDAFATMEKGIDASNLTTEIVLDDSITAPFNTGTPCGKMKVYLNGNLLSEHDVVTSGAVKKGGPLSAFGIPDKTAKSIFRTILFIILLLFLLFAGYLGYLKYKSNKVKAIKAARAAKAAAEKERQRKELGLDFNDDELL